MAKNTDLKISLAAQRKNHFALGGSPKLWCGKSTPHKDKKKQANKRACRGKGEW